MEVSLEGKVALVTGVGPNIGSGVALALARVLDVARPQVVVADGGLQPGLPVRHLPVLIPPGPDKAGDLEETGDTQNAGGIFLYTSGTTGTPKGVLLRDGQLAHVAACVAVHHRLTAADRGGAQKKRSTQRWRYPSKARSRS